MKMDKLLELKERVRQSLSAAREVMKVDNNAFNAVMMMINEIEKE